MDLGSADSRGNGLKRIASLLSSATEILCGMGLEDQIVAISHECDYPAQILEKPRATFAHIDPRQSSVEIDQQVKQRLGEGAPLYDLDRRLLLDLAPDLIVTQAQCDVCAIRLQDVVDFVEHHPVLASAEVLALNPVSYADIFEDILKVGRAVGAPERAEEFTRRLNRRTRAIEQITSILSPQQRPRVVCIEWIEPLMLAANWIPTLIEKAGGENGLTTADRHSGYHDWREVADYAPQVVIVSPCGFDLQRTVQEAQTLCSLDVWNRLPAVKNRRAYAVDGSAYMNRSGPRIVDTLEILAHLIHPDRFGPPATALGAWAPLQAPA